MSLRPANFKERTVEESCKLHFTESKTKMSSDALKIYCEALRVFVLEVATRAAEQAKKEDSEKVALEHLEKVLPQFLLDFS